MFPKTIGLREEGCSFDPSHISMDVYAASALFGSWRTWLLSAYRMPGALIFRTFDDENRQRIEVHEYSQSPLVVLYLEYTSTEHPPLQ